MGTTLKNTLRRPSDESDNRSFFTENRSKHPFSAEDVFDDPSLLVELAKSDESLLARAHATPASSMHLPPVDAFDFEEACRAERLAHKLGPTASSPDRASIAAPRRRQRDAGQAHYRQQQPPGRALPNSRRSFVWAIGAALATIIAVAVVYGFLYPVDTAPSVTSGEVAADSAGPAGPTPLDYSELPTTVDVGAADAGEAGARPNETVAVREEPGAAAIINPAMSEFAEPLTPPPADDNGGLPSAATPDAAPSKAELVAAPEPTEATTEVEAPLSDEVVPPNNAGDAAARTAQSQVPESSAQPEVDNVVAAVREPPSGGEPPDILSAQQIDQLLSRGEALLRNGDIASARLLFLRIAAAGDRRGAKAVGMTYDPQVYAQLPVTGLVPDPELAKTWYEKAGDQSTYTIDLGPAKAPEAPADPQEAALQQRDAACARKYASYDASTGLYTGRSGAKHPCQLP